MTYRSFNAASRHGRTAGRAAVLACALLVAVFPGLALAHPDGTSHAHGALAAAAHGFVHPFTGLDHLAAMLALGIWSALALRRPLAAPAAFVVALLLGAGLAQAGIVLPLVEPLVAASALVLGLLLAWRSRLPMAAAMVLSSFFAIFHGAAHGQELSASHAGSALLGMALGAVMLQLAGFGLGRLLADRPAWMARSAGVALAVTGLGLVLPTLAAMAR